MDASVLDKRQRILAAAARLIVKNGLQCSMAEIAQTAGVATGSIYNYFASKDDLVRGVYRKLTEDIAAVLIVDHGLQVSHEERLRRYIADYIEFVWADADRAILFEYLSNVPLIPQGELRKAFAPVTDFTTRLFTEAQEAGVVRIGHAADIGGFVGGGIRNVLKWRRAQGLELTGQARSQIVSMCWSAITGESGERHFDQTSS